MKKIISVLALTMAVITLEARFLLIEKDRPTLAQIQTALKAQNRIDKAVENLQGIIDKKEVAEQVADYIEQVKGGAIPTSKMALENAIGSLQNVLRHEIYDLIVLKREVEAAEKS